MGFGGFNLPRLAALVKHAISARAAWGTRRHGRSTRSRLSHAAVGRGIGGTIDAACSIF
jgi:hypothetical protein